MPRAARACFISFLDEIGLVGEEATSAARRAKAHMRAVGKDFILFVPGFETMSRLCCLSNRLLLRIVRFLLLVLERLYLGGAIARLNTGRQ